jgi:hypothetical protein
VDESAPAYVLDTGSAYSDRASTRIPGQPVFTLEPGFGGKRQTDAYIGVCSTDPKKFTKWALANLGYGCVARAAKIARRGPSASPGRPAMAIEQCISRATALSQLR